MGIPEEGKGTGGRKKWNKCNVDAKILNKILAKNSREHKKMDTMIKLVFV